jgi:uncharacterized protein YcbK (DUF882 family)
MITPKEYLMGRDIDSPLSDEQKSNMADLLSRVNYLLGWLQISRRISSGYRPALINKKVGGAVRSTHLLCMGIDLDDRDGTLKKLIMDNLKMLDDLDLYMESPEHTKTWVHLDTKKRKNRVFIP